MPAIAIREILSAELDIRFRRLGELLDEAVRSGASLGFLSPLRSDEARQYWHSLRPELERGSLFLLGAWFGNRLVGSGQLAFPASRNGHHRAELQKHFVGTRFQGLGIGRSLMTALHDGALQRRRFLIILNVRRGDSAERLYRGLGYREAGVVPGYTIGPTGERFDNAILYIELHRSSKNSTEY
jgi:ribosomal protein S18 acetylase RimI-like enzyme